MTRLPFSSLILLLLLIFVQVSEQKIIGAFVLPHGGIALNPSQFESPSKWAKQWAWTIHRSAVEVGKHIRQLEPALIFLSTPHGVADLTRFQFYLNGRANGTAETDNCQCPPCCYDVDVKMDASLTQNFINNLTAKGMNVSGSTFFGPVGGTEEPSLLKWGEVIPLIFIRDLVRTRLMVISQPARRYDNSVQMIPELLELGRNLYGQLEALPETVVVLISADLAHTHEATGPYGFSKGAEPFDRNVGNWAATLHPSYLLEQAATYANDAKSCGFTGLVMLHGLMEAGQLGSWIPVMHANYHPSYYGMMVASFSRGQRNGQAQDSDQPRFEDSNFAPQSHGDNILCPNCTPRRSNNRVAP